MKRLLLFALLTLGAATTTYAQKDKVAEASDKRKPDWIGRSDQSHFAVTEVAETLAEASDKCMASIRQYVVTAVAVNISSTEKMATRQITHDALTTVMNDYSSVLMTEAGQLPYLNDLTLSNAAATYWEKIYSKRTKTYRYEFSVLYPFSEQTRRSLVDAFTAIDDAKQAHYMQLRAELETISDLDRIQQVLNELDELASYFFDSMRKGEVETLRRNYLALYNTVSIEPESESPGVYVYSLRLAGRRVTTTRPPRLKSESAIELETKPCGDNCYVLTYNPEYASPADLNKIELTYTFGGAKATRTILFEAPSKKLPARPVGVLRLEQADGVIRGTLAFSGEGQPQVRQLELLNPTDGARLLATRLGAPQADAGKQTIEFETTGTIGRAANGVDIMQGTCMLYDAQSRQTRQVDFTLPYTLTTK